MQMLMLTIHAVHGPARMVMTRSRASLHLASLPTPTHIHHISSGRM